MASRIIQTNVKNIQEVPQEFRVFLSGPISAHISYYQGVKFLFFGDQHFSMEGTCPIPCSDINLETSEYIDIPKCFDIVALLSTIYKQAENSKIYIDTYLERAYLSPELDLIKNVENKDVLLEEIKTQGYISKIWATFHDCFLKLKCSSFTRFHYVDLREVQFPRDVQNAHFDNIIIFELNILLDLPFGSPRMIKKFEKINTLIRAIYQKHNLSNKLFSAILESDDYINKVTKLIHKHLPTLSKKTRENFIDELAETIVISQVDGKIQHRVRKQLYQLEKEGQSELASKIRDYTKDLYFGVALSKEILRIWDKIYPSYQNFVQHPSSQSARLMFAQKLKNVRVQIKRLTDSAVNIVDAYTLGRLFRTFPGTNHQPSSIRIIYAGDYHIRSYKNFFENWLDVPVTSYRSSPENIRCLEIDARDFLGETLIAT